MKRRIFLGERILVRFFEVCKQDCHKFCIVVHVRKMPAVQQKSFRLLHVFQIVSVHIKRRFLIFLAPKHRRRLRYTTYIIALVVSDDVDKSFFHLVGQHRIVTRSSQAFSNELSIK